MSRNDAKQLTEQFQAVLLQLQTAVAEIEDQINVALDPPSGPAPGRGGPEVLHG